MTRLRQPQRLVLDTLVDAGVARSRSEALAWCVRLVGQHEDDWLAELRDAMGAVADVRGRAAAARADRDRRSATRLWRRYAGCRAPLVDRRHEPHRHRRPRPRPSSTSGRWWAASGRGGLREDQWTAIEALAVHRRRSLVVQRTGWGKSAVYFVATLLLREQGAGPTVIVSPLLALMRNQIAAAERAGIRAVTINSTNIESWEPIQEAMRNGEVDVLLVSPERLNNPGFRDEVLPRLAATCGLLVVDEAHCISDWGHDFRPDYRRIRTLLGDLPDGIPVLATTATANARVTADVAEQLGTDVLVLRGSLDRESLRLGVVRLTTAAAAAGLAGRPPRRAARLRHRLLPTVAATQEIADYLRSRGHDVAAYSGQTDPTERQALEEDLIAGRVKALVATSALGMGFDATLGFVVNMGAPASPVAYYQQVGRAGRGTDRERHGRAAARRSRTATSGPTSPRWPSPARSSCARPSRCSPTRAGR